MKVLVVNAGSSSLKYQLLNTETKEVLGKGICERIGMEGSLIDHKLGDGSKKIKKEIPMPDHSVATEIVVSMLTDKEYGCISDMSEIEAVGHRVVHGGTYFFDSCLVTDEVLEAIKKCIEFAPLHNPANLMGIAGCTKVMPNVPQVAVFDTAFHQTMPEASYMYALPYEYYEKYKIRRYGFHGTSHRYVSERAIAHLGKPADQCNVVTCHLGNGASFAAVKGGKCFDTSMGVTPLEGIMMGTRSGNIDPAIIPYLMRKGELTTADDIDKMMNKKSGMLGVSGKTSDNQEIGRLAESGDRRALLCEEMYSHQIAKNVGSYIVAMGGADAIVFTGGIGENAGHYRAELIEKLAFLGVKLDPEKNKVRGEEIEISTPDSPIKVYVIPTNEELVIARDTLAIVSAL